MRQRFDQLRTMKINIFSLIAICIISSCSSSENSSKGVSYHFFRQNGQIGIVDSRGEITCEPKFDSDVYFPTEFDNFQRSKFTSIYNDKENRNLIIDIYGNEPFPNATNLKYKNEGNFAIYFDDFAGGKGLHVLSLNNKEEIGYYENRVAINFYGNTKYFYSILNQKKWRLFNELGDNIYEEGYRLDVDVLEIDNEFEAIVLSRGGAEIKYLDSNGKELPPSKSLQSKFHKLQKQKEIDYKKEYPKYSYETIPVKEYSKKVNKYEVVKAIKYESGEEIYFVSKNNMQGVVNSEGKILLEIKYENISSDYKMLFFSKEGKRGMARLNGEIIYQPKFNSIRYEAHNSRYVDLRYNEYWFEADINGKIFTPKNIKIE